MAARVSPFGRPQQPRSAWRALEMHYRKIRELHLRDLFSNDPNRGERMAVEAAGLYLDYSKNRMTTNTVKLLIDLAEESGLYTRIDAMFRGEKVNTTEERPALHIALRAPRGTSIFVDGNNVVPQVHRMLDRMTQFCNQVREGKWLGYTGKRIRHLINIGTGAFHLGPAMAFEALRYYQHPSLSFHFLGNIDVTDFVECVRNVDPAETLFIICSRTFTTLETMTNAQTARAWVLSALGANHEAVSKHFVAVSANPNEAEKFGIERINIFELWDWIADAYSIGSAVSLSTMLSVGPEKFATMLDGFHQMDMHYLASPFERNLPVLLGLISIWYNNLLGARSVAVIPYEQYLNRFSTYLQQLVMQSNGKNVTLIGTKATQNTSPIFWGDTGTNAQHSFSQFLNQGTSLVPCDLIAFLQPLHTLGRHHDILIASLLAHAEALAFGRSTDDVRAEGTPDWLVPHRVLSGNHPSNVILAHRLTPETLGKLVALYQHSVYTQGVIWNINSFDQWAVELGDQMAERILLELENKEESQLAHDSSTSALIRRYRQLKNAAC
jgi:glucose-6-phosphate isomerase